MRYLSIIVIVGILAGFGLMTTLPTTLAADTESWGTIKGQVVFGGDTIPEPEPLDVNKDQGHCLAKGKILSEKWVINPKNKGVRDTFVWLAPATGQALPIHPDLKEAKLKDAVMDQPCCKFEPHALALRKGQKLIVKNSAPIAHNVKWFGGLRNPGNNVILPPGAQKEIDNLNAYHLPVFVDCNIHPWMRAIVRVFDHPYFAVTDENGEFTIPKAPAGKYNLVIWHDAVGWGPGGKPGMPITIKAEDATDPVQISLKPAE